MKAIIINDNPAVNDNQKYKVVVSNQEVEIQGTFAPGLPAMQAIQSLRPDIVLIESAIAYALNEAKVSLQSRNEDIARCYISASTHHGIQLLPVAAVHFFRAEHKYVVAHHEHGQLLINDSLASLEKEFANLFIRIHRNTLVAKQYIEALEKTAANNWQMTLTCSTQKLLVSRRQLALVRKYLQEFSITR